jgi:hypothetical protein
MQEDLVELILTDKVQSHQPSMKMVLIVDKTKIKENKEEIISLNKQTVVLIKVKFHKDSLIVLSSLITLITPLMGKH